MKSSFPAMQSLCDMRVNNNVTLLFVSQGLDSTPTNKKINPIFLCTVWPYLKLVDFPPMWKCWHDLAKRIVTVYIQWCFISFTQYWMWINFSAIFFIESKRFHATLLTAKLKRRTLHPLPQCWLRGILPSVLS